MSSAVRRAVPLLLAVGGASLTIHGGWIHAKAALAQVLLERAWQDTLGGETRVRPWRWADTWPVARIEIPRLATRFVVLSGATGRTLAFAPGHSEGSALPGAVGTAIVSGHRDTHFAALRELRRGDELRVERADGIVVRYMVESLEVADARTSRIGIAAGGRWLVLVTCWPFDAAVPGGPLRYVAVARALDASES